MRVAIIGLGLIGGSIGLALKRSNEPRWEIVGYARHPEAASAALDLGAIDRVETDFKQAVKETDIVIIATPVLTIKDIFFRIADYLPPGCVVTDTASTKFQVVAWADVVLPPTVDFIGGHPMAGKEIYGIQAAEAGLFQGCTYCLTPAKRASKQALDKVMDMVNKLGATPVLMGAQEHDELVAGISHLPLLLSTALVSATTGDVSWPEMAKLAASGYRDLTRLASGNPEVNAHICLSNQKAILRWIDRFNQELDRYRGLVSAGDKHLEEVLTKANKSRQQWLDRAE